MEDQGIGSLAPQNVSDEEFGKDLFEVAKSVATPENFSKGTMAALREQDPESAAMVDQIMSMQLPANIVEGLLELIDLIFEDPQSYPLIRQESIAAGVPEEILPPEFDLEYFSMLQMALQAAPRGPATPEMPDEGEMMPEMGMPGMGQAPQQFAMGGEVSGDPKMKMVAQYLQSQGRYGDTILAHINPEEAAMLKRMGGSGTINPVTGLPEFLKGISFKKAAKKVGNAFKSAGKAVVNGVKAVAKGVKSIAKSPVGKIAIAVGLAVATGGTSLAASASAATGLSVPTIAGAVGGLGASALAGDKPEDIIKNTLLGAAGGATYNAINTGGFSIPGFGGASTTGTQAGGTSFLGKIGEYGKTILGIPGQLGNLVTGGAFAGKSGIAGMIPLIIGGTGLAYAAGAFDKEQPTPEDLGLGFETDKTPTEKAFDLMAEDPDKYNITFGDITTSRTADPYGEANARTGPITPPVIEVGGAGVDTSGPFTPGDYVGAGRTNVRFPGYTPPSNYDFSGAPAGIGERVASGELPSFIAPPVYETLPEDVSTEQFTGPGIGFSPEALALADKYGIDVTRGFAQGGLVQAFAKGGEVKRITSAREAQRLARKAPKSRNSAAAQIKQSRVNSSTNRKPANIKKANAAQDKKFSKPVPLGNARAEAARRERAAQASRAGKMTPQTFTASRSQARPTSGPIKAPPPAYLQSIQQRVAAQERLTAPSSRVSRPVPADIQAIVNREAAQAQRDRPMPRPPSSTTPAPKPPPVVSSRPTPAPATPAPATPAPATPAPPIDIGGSGGIASLASPVSNTPSDPVGPPSVPVLSPPASVSPSVMPSAPVSPSVMPSAPVSPSVMPPAVNPTSPIVPVTTVPNTQTLFPTTPPTFSFPSTSTTPAVPTAPTSPTFTFPGISNQDLEQKQRDGFAQGGLASLNQPVYGYVGGGTPQYPRRNGEIAGPGTGTSDDIPAMLSDGEFVFTAKSVRNMGGGDRKEGAKRMYAMMKKLENGGMA